MSIREHKRNINQCILIRFDIIIVCIIFVRDNVKIAMISIIVPLYNAEKYVHACVESILGQTYKDFELLLVDDGSKDSTGTICDKYANDDHRVRVFHKKFGEGTISIVEPEGDDLKVDINFDKVGHKRLMAKYANLEVMM